ncbi:hypothetical protein MJ863_02315 [Alcaligenes ammonioxydans]|jgi:hypothetical protein|uniref:Lipoprotein n=1 Tax=Alcaligenes ammonioxydans TaxID=2582914 RepID=A0ABX8SWD0_9BURK|nr:hypothetical protein [Alcaligenes ammonioxydans]EJC65573.1 hypothetical protein QWA_01905 [Alcaligenes faecalis subsp. faecalis NCIB 8687]QBH18062.1 hypothetical protein EYC51_00280 [Alcaligenes faecalis]MCH1878421.1 hypothetical protein [Alcaligenes ammonioxydans]QXX79213.1 hypothetical protein FE795_09440 [Alcaligenes ammonioxydans]WGQ34125.1 hypothetical protein QEZ63_09450 [Alcaligenes faecalis]
MWKTALVVGAAALLAGCQDSRQANEENFSTAIQSYLDSRDGLCVGVPGRSYPYQAEHDSPLIVEDRARLAALASVGLVRQVGTEQAPRYELTPQADTYLRRAGSEPSQGERDAFCTGRLVLKRINYFTEPASAGGFTVSQVNYVYHLADAAPWITDGAVLDAYEDLRALTAPEVQGQARLILTNKGWVHQNLFR